MINSTNKKFFSLQITDRFVIAMNTIVGNKSGGKVTAHEFGNVIGISSSNLIRLKNTTGQNFVTIEAIGRICKHYNISPLWLINGQGDMYIDDNLAAAHRTMETRLRDVEVVMNNIQKSLQTIKKGN